MSNIHLTVSGNGLRHSTAPGKCFCGKKSKSEQPEVRAIFSGEGKELEISFFPCPHHDTFEGALTGILLELAQKIQTIDAPPTKA